MKKLILVIFIGLVFALNVYGFVNGFMIENVEEIDHIAETTSIVYME